MTEPEPYRWPDNSQGPAAPALAPAPAPSLVAVPGQRQSGPASLPDLASVPVYAEEPDSEEAPAAAMRERWTDRVSRVVRLTAGRPAVPPRSGYGPAAAARPSERPARPDDEPELTRQRPLRWPEARTSSFRSHLTARGALLGMFVLCLLACLIGGWRQLDILDGLAYCAGCVAMPVYARRDAQLRVVVSAPAVFLLALIMTQALTAQGSSAHGSVYSVLEGTLLTLADVAPWLFAGTAIVVAVALTQGLRQCVRELRAGPASQGGVRRTSAHSARDPWASADRGADGRRARGPGQRSPGA